MRIYIITQNEPVYAPVYLSKIIQHVNHEIIGITALSPSGNVGWLNFAKQRFEMYGLFDFFRAGLIYVSYRIKDFFKRTNKANRFYSVSRLAEFHSIPVYASNNVNDPEFVKLIKTKRIDFLISVAANQRFRIDLLQTPKIACLNIHSSLLPKYPGIDALFWALVHNETQVGVTVHEMNEAIDGGDILGQIPFDVTPEDSLHSLYFKSINIGSKLLGEVLDQYEKGSIKPKAGNVKSSDLFSWPTAEAANQFRKNGRKFF